MATACLRFLTFGPFLEPLLSFPCLYSRMVWAIFSFPSTASTDMVNDQSLFRCTRPTFRSPIDKSLAVLCRRRQRPTRWSVSLRRRASRTDEKCLPLQRTASWFWKRSRLPCSWEFSLESVFGIANHWCLVGFDLSFGAAERVHVAMVRPAGIGRWKFVGLIQPVAVLNRSPKWVVLHVHGIELRSEFARLNRLNVGLVNLLHDLEREHEIMKKRVGNPRPAQHPSHLLIELV